jgi:hypothetical protein
MSVLLVWCGSASISPDGRLWQNIAPTFVSVHFDLLILISTIVIVVVKATISAMTSTVI